MVLRSLSDIFMRSLSSTVNPGGKQVQRSILKKDTTGFVCNWKGKY